MPIEESFAKAFHANPAPMVISDLATGRIVDVNRNWVAMIGYSAEEQVGRSSAELGIWEDPGVRDSMAKQIEQSGSVREVPARLRTKPGDVRDVLWSAEMIAYQGQQVMLSLLYDVTDRRRAEESLRASEERFRRLLQNSNDIVSILDERGVRIFTAGPIERILGYGPHELTGTSAFEHIHPADRAKAEAVFRGGLHLPGEVRRFEYRFRHKNGSWILIETIGTNLLHDPVVRGIVLNSRDVTERNRMQDQLQQAAKMEALGRLAGGVAHDFNNLLTAIGGNVELARLALARRRPVAEPLDEAHRAVKSAVSLTRQLLSFSRGQMNEAKVVSAPELVEESKRLLVRILGEDVDLQVIASREAGWVRIDPGQFEQVLVNLAINARDAMPKGGRLLIETRTLALPQPYAQGGAEGGGQPYVLITVSDNGHGMSREVKQRLFEPFFTTKPKGRGTGLGLATSFTIVKQAGGHIEVRSDEGAGTTFEIYLPRVEGGGDTAVEAHEGQASPGHETVLLVEDDAPVRAMTANMLAHLGYHVLTAAAGEEALAVAAERDGSIDVVLTDVVMPGMNGSDLAEQLRARWPRVKVLFISGYAQEVVARYGIAGAPRGFLAKPFTLPALAGKLRELLEGGADRLRA